MSNGLTIIKYLAFSLEIIILAVLQSTPGLVPEVFRSRPVLLVSAAFAIAATQRQTPSMIFGAVCGAAEDLLCGSAGFFAVALTLACFFEAQIFSKWLKSSALTAAVCALGGTAVVLCLYFALFRLIPNPQDAAYLFVHHYISRIIYTFICAVPLYFINSFLSRSLQSKTRRG